MWTKIGFVNALLVFRDHDWTVEKEEEGWIDLADARGTILHVGGGHRLGVVSRFEVDPIDIDACNFDVDGVEGVGHAVAPEFYLWRPQCPPSLATHERAPTSKPRRSKSSRSG